MYDTFEQYWRAIVDSGSDIATYASQLREWQKAFGESNLLVLFYDDLTKDRQSYLNQVCEFIGIPRVPLDQAPAGDSKVFSAPAAAKSNRLARQTVVAIDWIGKHGGGNLVRLGKSTRLRKKIRDLFVVDFETLDPGSADELYALMLAETEELERMTGRDLSSWKPGAKRSGDSPAARIQPGPQ